MNRSPRIMLYSHDTQGLGHIRRNRKIADALMQALPQAEIVIATGSRFAGDYREQRGVSLVHLPAVKKHSDGSYGPVDASLSFDELIRQRSSKLAETAEKLKPDLVIADKEAAGLKGELIAALKIAKSGGAKIVLGLREVLDDPDVVRMEWTRNGTIETIERYFDAIWIYGPENFHDPLEGIALPENVAAMKHYCGYLPFDPGGKEPALPSDLPEDFILVTTGGGGDGEALLRAVFAAARETDGFRIPLVILPGPYLNPASRSEFLNEAERIGGIKLLDFDPESERLMAASSGVVAMCGYNTFCEVLQLDKAALFIPRETPRREQLIRAARASELGLSHLLRIGDVTDPATLVSAINALPASPKPSQSAFKPDFDGVRHVGDEARQLLGVER